MTEPNKELRERIATILLREFGIGAGKVSMLNIAEEILALLPQPEEKEFNPQSMDAVVWAKEFMRVYNSPKAGVQLLDEDSMRSWFANAIMAGYDEAKRRYDKPQPEVMGEEDILEIVIDKAGYMYPNECRAIAHALANKIPVEKCCSCGQEWVNHDNRKCKPIKQPAKNELPEPIEFEVTGYQRIDYDELELLKKFNRLIKYLRERE